MLAVGCIITNIVDLNFNIYCFVCTLANSEKFQCCIFLQACKSNKCIDLTPSHSGGSRIDGRWVLLTLHRPIIFYTSSENIQHVFFSLTGEICSSWDIKVSFVNRTNVRCGITSKSAKYHCLSKRNVYWTASYFDSIYQQHKFNQSGAFKLRLFLVSQVL